MEEKAHEIREVRLDDLISFQLQKSQEYQGERLDQLVGSIGRVGLMNPIIVRPVDEGKYEIICGHNRTNAMRELGRDVIRADVRRGLSDEEALELFYDSNLNQQSFSEWNYSQKIKAIQYTERLIKEGSQQGRRSDLSKKEEHGIEDEERTSVQSRHKSEKKIRRSTTRDRMARRLGIATATFSKYRSIIKLPDDLIEVLARMLDEKKITFEAAYRISGLKSHDVKTLVEYIEKHPGKKIDLTKLKELCARRKGLEEGAAPVLSRDDLKGILVSGPIKISAVHRK